MKTLRALVVLLLIACLPGAARSQSCLSATVNAQETAPGSAVWKYCVSLTYDVTALAQSPRHLKLFLPGMTGCPCAAAPGRFAFQATAGTTRGTDPSTGIRGTVQWGGEVDWGDDLELPSFPGPAIQWNLPPDGTCEPDIKGVGRFCFLSQLPPTAPTSATAVFKVGRLHCSATLTGPLPGCDCATSVGSGTWGRLKTIYR